MLLSWYLTWVEYFQKPNENMINNQVILNQMNSDSITVKTEVRLADQRQNHIILLYYELSISKSYFNKHHTQKLAAGAKIYN